MCVYTGGHASVCARACLHGRVEEGGVEARSRARGRAGAEGSSAAAVSLRVYASTRIYAGGKSDGPADAPCAGAPYRSAVSRAA